MRVQIARMVTAPLSDGVTGLAVQLAGLTLDGADTRPETPVAIVSEADDDRAVTMKGLADWPLVLVGVDNPAQLDIPNVGAMVQLDVKSLLVTVALVTRDGADPAQAWRDTSYTLVAAIKALARGLFGADKAAARTRAGVTIVKLNNWNIVPSNYAISKGGTIYGALTLDLYVRHTL